MTLCNLQRRKIGQCLTFSVWSIYKREFTLIFRVVAFVIFVLLCTLAYSVWKQYIINVELFLFFGFVYVKFIVVITTLCHYIYFGYVPCAIYFCTKCQILQWVTAIITISCHFLCMCLWQGSIACHFSESEGNLAHFCYITASAGWILSSLDKNTLLIFALQDTFCFFSADLCSFLSVYVAFVYCHSVLQLQYVHWLLFL